MVIAQVDCQDNNITSVRLGAQIPLFDTASGRVLAAWMDGRALASLLDLADGPDNRRTEFIDGLADVREKGNCGNASLTIEGVQNISAPIRDFSGKVIAALTIPFIKRLSGTSIKSADECREALLEVCRSISRQLGASVHSD
nr:IclR family transcriptional regulator C-terminal domain-containing protein [Roseibium litorale]